MSSIHPQYIVKAWRGTERTVEVKWTAKKYRPSEEGPIRKAKAEGRGPQESGVMVGEVPTGSNMH